MDLFPLQPLSEKQRMEIRRRVESLPILDQGSTCASSAFANAYCLQVLNILIEIMKEKD